MTIERLPLPASQRDRAGLVALLMDVVNGGASVNFLPPFSADESGAFWARALDQAANRERLIFVAREDETGRILGSAQLGFAPQPNQRHRADVQKILVLNEARRRGLGRALMAALEQAALAHGMSLLTLDTVAGDAGEQLYRSVGFIEVGDIPNYCKLADGGFGATRLFYKEIATHGF